MTHQENPDYAHWRASLKALREGKPLPPIQENSPQCGFWRRRYPGKDDAWFPAAIWRDKETGLLVCAFNGIKGDEAYAIKHWTWIAKNPIEQETYFERIKTGEWPDGAQGARKSNLPSDPFERLMVEYQTACENAERIFNEGPKLTDQKACNRASNLIRTFQKVLSDADDLFEDEKKPIREQAAAVDAKYIFRKKNLADVVRKLKGLVGVFMAAEERRLKAEAERERLEALKKAEEERAAREAELKKLEEQDVTLAHLVREEMPTEAAPPPRPQLIKVQGGGGVGPKIGLKSVWRAEITDYDAVLNYLKERQVVRDLIQDLIHGELRATKGQSQIPGIRIFEERVAA